MAEQTLLAKLGLRLGVLGSAASLAFAAPSAAGSYDPACHTAANRTGMFFDQSAAAERAAFMVGGLVGPSFNRSGTVVNLLNSGSITAKSGSLVGIALVPQGGAANFTGSLTTALLSANRTYTFPDADASIVGGTVGSTQVAYGAGGNALTGDAAFTRGVLTFGVDPSADNVLSTGYGQLGFVTGGTSTSFYLAQVSNFTTGSFALRQSAVGNTHVGAKAGQTVSMGPGGSASFSVTASVTSTLNPFSTISTITAKNGTLAGIAMVPQGGVGNFTGSMTTAALTANRTYTFPDADTAVMGGTIAVNQVAFGSGSNTIQGSANLTFDGTTTLTVTGNTATLSANLTNALSTGRSYLIQFNNNSDYNYLGIHGSAYVGTLASTGLALAGLTVLTASAGHLAIGTGASKSVYVFCNNVAPVATFSVANITFAQAVTLSGGLTAALPVGSGGTGVTSLAVDGIMTGGTTVSATTDFKYVNSTHRITSTFSSSTGQTDAVFFDDSGSSNLQICKQGTAFAGNFGSTSITNAGLSYINASSFSLILATGAAGKPLYILTNSTVRATFADALITFVPPMTVSDATDASSGSTGAFNTAGGIGATKAIYAGTTLTAAGGTVTASTPVLNLAQTWNSGAVVFTGILLNVTNSASSVNSLLIDLQVGGASFFNIARNGSTTLAGNLAMTANTISVGGITQSNTNTGTSGSLTATAKFFQTVNPAGSSTAILAGNWSACSTASGCAQNITDATGGLRGVASFATHGGTGTVTAAVAVLTQVTTTNSSGTITSAIGLRCIDGSKAGGTTITTLYGIKVDDQTAGTTNYAIHTGTGIVRFGGIVRFDGTNSTGAGTATLGAANCPAVTPAAVYTWVTVTTADGSTGFIPVWK